MTFPFPTMTLPEIVGEAGLLTDGDWVESKDQDESGTIRLTQLADVGDGEFLDRSDRWLNEEQAARLGVTYLAPGDVLVARMPDPLGRACVCPALPTRAITVVDVCVVRAPAHNARWIMHALNAPQTRSRVAGLQSGSTRKRISKGNLSTIPIPMPPRDTQDRLVAAIDMQLSRLDAAVASLTRAKANVANARASVLQAAVGGRLLAPAVGQARMAGWHQVRFDDVFVAMSDGGRKLPRKAYAPTGRWPVIDQGEAFIGGYSDRADLVWGGALPLIVFGDHTRRFKLVRSPFIVGADGVKLIGLTDAWVPEFALIALQTLRFADRGYSRHFQFVRDGVLPLPPLAEQARIVAEVERRFSVLDALDRTVGVNLTRAQHVRQAILKLAFEGRLLGPPTADGDAASHGMGPTETEL